MIARIQENTVIITSDIDGWLWFLRRLLSIMRGSIDHGEDTYLNPVLGDLEEDSLSILLVRVRETISSFGNKNISLMVKEEVHDGIHIYGNKEGLLLFLNEIINVISFNQSRTLSPGKVLDLDSIYLTISVLSETAGE